MAISNLFFILMLIFGPLISVSASTWPVCWAGMEVGFLGLVPLLFMGGISFSKEAALKYFCVQALASGMMFMGGCVLYTMYSDSTLYAVLFLAGICLKLALFPGHFWVTGVIYGLEWVSCCFILGPLKVAPLAFLVELNILLPHLHVWVLILASASAIAGASLGNNQTNIRAMLGASSVAHGGWMAVASVYGGLWEYLALYFLVLCLVLLHLWQGDKFCSALGIMSMSGLPPFLMFVAKLNVIFCVMSVEGSYLWLVLPLASAVLSLMFYLKFSYSLFLTTGRFAGRFSIFTISVLNFIGVAWFLLTLF
nr:NADH dehydrogenase subunit 2 [Onchidium reevesii]UZH97738.1 NADH dehydrogenase subunit 2 [Onchidium reevesii]